MVLHYDDSRPSGPADVLSFGGLDVRGEVSIQLYDERGNLKYEEKGDNYILPLAKQTLFKTMVYQMFARSLKDNSASSPFEDGVNRLFLTDYTGPKEPSYETHRRGSGAEIGWADLSDTYSGDNTFRGSINVRESFSRADSIRIVVDFPSHAANDREIGSVYLVNNRNNKQRRWLATDVPTDILKVESSYQRFWRLQDKRIVQQGPGNVLNELDPNTLAVSRELDNVDFSFSDAEFANGKFYYVNSSDWVREHAGPGSETVIKRVDGYSRFSGISYANGKFVLWARRDSGSIWGALETDRNFNFIRFVPYSDLNVNNSSWSILEPSIYEDGLFCLGGYGTLDHDLTGYFNDFSDAQGLPTFIGYLPGGKLFTYRGEYLELIPRPFGIVTRYELDNPFAKRPGETMKVIYDIIVEGEPFNPMKDPARFIK